MSTTNLVKDGVGAYGLVGTTSATGAVKQTFPFAAIVLPQQSVNVYMNASQCDVYWDITPLVDPAAKQTFIANSGKQLFVPCGKTLACSATVKWYGNVGFADLTCSAPV